MNSSPPPANSSKTPRKWPKRLLLVLGSVILVLWSINGPIARKVVHIAIDKILLDQDMVGDCRVKGTLTRGFTLRDFHYHGKAGLQQIKANQITADYRLLRELIHGKIRKITLRDASLIIDIDKFASTGKKKESSILKLKDTIELARSWVSQPEIKLKNIDLTILKSSEAIAKFSLESLQHPARSDTYQLSRFRAFDSNGYNTPEQNINLLWSPSKLDLTRIELFPDITLESASVDWKKKLEANLQLSILTAALDIKIDENIRATLVSGLLDSDTLKDRLNLNLPFDFELEHINAQVVGWTRPISQWDINMTAGLPSAHYQEFTASDTQFYLIQSANKYQASIQTKLQNAPVHFKINGSWSTPLAHDWWSNTVAEFSLQCPSLHQLPKSIQTLPEAFDFSATAIDLAGSLEISHQKLVSLGFKCTSKGAQVSSEPIPKLTLSGSFSNQDKAQIQLNLNHIDQQPLALTAEYHFSTKNYSAQIDIHETNTTWVNHSLAAFNLATKLHPPLQINWSGSGSSSVIQDQQGQLHIESLDCSISDDLQLQLDSELQYHWPHSFTVSDLNISDKEFSASAQLLWDGQFLTLNKGSISSADSSLATLSATIPFNTKITSLETFLDQTAPWKLDLDLTPLPVQKINQWLELTETRQLGDLDGTVSLNLDLIGSPAVPNMKGSAKLQNLRGLANKNVAPIHMLAEFHSEQKVLNFSGHLLEGDSERAHLTAEVPFTPLDWVKNAHDLSHILETSSVDGSLAINTLPLNRAARIIPQLKEIHGELTGNASIKGTLAEPDVELNTEINIPLLVTAGEETDDIRDLIIRCKVNTDRELHATAEAHINGGEFLSEAHINFADIKSPTFDISAKTNYAMVFRNDAISIRANADIKLKGTPEIATLSGDINIVESLFYKDIDILPIGVPSSAVSQVELPAVNSNQFSLPVPEAIKNWNLDLTLGIKDPILIRGNIAKGQIEGKIKATGSVGNPLLDGQIFTKDVVARLPFSELRINKGQINFNANNGLIPTLDIQGKSLVNNYDISVVVYGPATAPKTTFYSYPPLAKNDVMTLLATGTTASNLSNNKEVATLRALQLFVAKLKQESGNKRSTQLLEKALSSVDDFEFNINESDGFTGRKFSSAKIKLNPRLYLTAQVDEEKNTRGLVVFVLKFR